jgi:hypothetical protein
MDLISAISMQIVLSSKVRGDYLISLFLMLSANVQQSSPAQLVI